MKKRIFIYAVCIIIVVFLCYFLWEHAVLPSLAKVAIKYVTALEVSMKRVIANPLAGSLTIHGLTIFNPPRFADAVLMRAPLVTIDYKGKTVFERGTFLDTIAVHIKELTIVRDADNTVNLSLIKALTPQAKQKNSSPFSVDRYILSIDTVRYVDHTKEPDKRERVFDLNISEEYKNLKNSYSIPRLLAFKIFYNGQIGNIGVNIQEIQKDLAQLAERNKKLADEFTAVQKERLKKAKEAVGEGVDTTKAVVGAVKDAAKAQVEKTKDAVNGGVQATKTAVGAVKEATQAQIDKTKATVQDGIDATMDAVDAMTGTLENTSKEE